MSFFNKLFSTKKKIRDKPATDKKSVVDEPTEKTISKEIISQEINVSVKKKQDKILLDSKKNNFIDKLFKKKKDSLNKGLKLSSESFFSKISKAIVGKSKVDDKVLDQLEEILISSDVGVKTTLKIIDRIENRVTKDKYINTDELDLILKEEIISIINNKDVIINNFKINEDKKPHVILVVGVNGAGKTTTVGKMANYYKSLGLKVVIGAADTFRAAAIE